MIIRDGHLPLEHGLLHSRGALLREVPFVVHAVLGLQLAELLPFPLTLRVTFREMLVHVTGQLIPVHELRHAAHGALKVPVVLHRLRRTQNFRVRAVDVDLHGGPGRERLRAERTLDRLDRGRGSSGRRRRRRTRQVKVHAVHVRLEFVRVGVNEIAERTTEWIGGA